LETLRRIRQRTDQRITVDANSGWTREQAVALIPELARLRVEFVEQPLAPEDLEGLRWVHERSELPVYADESACVSSDVFRLAGAVDGINLKLAKTGGIGEALRVIATARACGLAVMIGCMIESSLGITSAAHLAPLVDHLDLDGHWLLARDPFEGVGGGAGGLLLRSTPGMGVAPRGVTAGDRTHERAGGAG